MREPKKLRFLLLSIYFSLTCISKAHAVTYTEITLQLKSQKYSIPEIIQTLLTKEIAKTHLLLNHIYSLNEQSYQGNSSQKALNYVLEHVNFYYTQLAKLNAAQKNITRNSDQQEAWKESIEALAHSSGLSYSMKERSYEAQLFLILQQNIRGESLLLSSIKIITQTKKTSLSTWLLKSTMACLGATAVFFWTKKFFNIAQGLSQNLDDLHTYSPIFNNSVQPDFKQLLENLLQKTSKMQGWWGLSYSETLDVHGVNLELPENRHKVLQDIGQHIQVSHFFEYTMIHSQHYLEMLFTILSTVTQLIQLAKFIAIPTGLATILALSKVIKNKRLRKSQETAQQQMQQDIYYLQDQLFHKEKLSLSLKGKILFITHKLKQYAPFVKGPRQLFFKKLLSTLSEENSAIKALQQIEHFHTFNEFTLK